MVISVGHMAVFRATVIFAENERVVWTFKFSVIYLSKTCK